MDPFVQLALQLGVVLAAAVVLGHLAERAGLPAVVGELAAGVLLGPSALGALSPTWFAALFPPDDLAKTARDHFLKVGLLLFMLVVGLDVDPRALASRWRVIVPTSALGLVLPFAAGAGSVLAWPTLWGAPAGAGAGLVLTIGVALAISALPVIARILADLGLDDTEVGRIVLASAVIDDLVGWVGFAAIIGAFAARDGPGRSAWEALVTVAAGSALALALGHGAVLPAVARAERDRPDGGVALGLVLAAMLAAAALMERAGVHAFFGALLVGVAVSRLDRRLFDPVRRLARAFFTPLYFGMVGVGIDLVAGFDGRLVALVFLVACAGKFVGASIGARLGGLPVRPALAVAAGLNARGAVGVVLAALARGAGLIDERIFVALVTMALGTSVLAGIVMPRVLGTAAPSPAADCREPARSR